MDERQAFESGIDANPLDATNHLVYADWLDEHGEADEAAFRRAMGQWIGGQQKGSKYPFSRQYPQYRLDSSAAPRFKMHWKAASNNLPVGIDPKNVETYNNMPVRTHWIFRGDGTGYWPRDPAHAAFDWENAPEKINNFHWGSYRGMEEGLRRAFLKGRPQQMARAYSRAFRASQRA